MTLKKKILLGIVSLLAVAGAAFAITISHTTPCGPLPALPASATRMQAIVHSCYGGGETLRLGEVAKPVPRDDQVLVRVRASSINPYDWHMTTGTPYLMRLAMGLGAPEDSRAGSDFAGVVEAVGAKVTKFKPGDEVFGGGAGALAEYLTASESRAIAHKPAELSFDEAASIPIAGITALQALRDHGHLQPGQKILINGASGGVGTFAIQIARAYGAQVTAVCSTKNVAPVRALGADQVVDYTREDFTRRAERYDLILDNVGNRSFSELRSVLVPRGTVVVIGGPKGPWIDPFIPMIKTKLITPFSDEKFEFFVANMNSADLALLADLAHAGKLHPAVGARYALRDVPRALDYLGSRHASGKVVVEIS